MTIIPFVDAIARLSASTANAKVDALRAAVVAAGVLTGSAGTVPPPSTYSGPNALMTNKDGNATTPHQDAFLSAALVSLDVRIKMAASTLIAGGEVGRLVSCWGSSLDGWIFYTSGTGYLGFIYANNTGNGPVITYVGTPIPVSATADIWLRMTYAFSGPGSLVLRIYTSSDNVSYSQVGNDATVAANAALLKLGTAPLQIGSVLDGPLAPGTAIKAAQLIANGAKVVDVDFTTAAVGAATVTASTGQVFTINGAAAIGASSSASGSASTPPPSALPAITTSTSSATFVAGATSGTVATLSAVPASATRTLLPGDGRLALNTAGTAIVVGLTASAAGTINATVQDKDASTGAVSPVLAVPVTVTAATSVPPPAPAPAAGEYSGPTVATPVAACSTLFGSYWPNNTTEPAEIISWLGRSPDLASVHTGQGSADDFVGSVRFCIGSSGYAGPMCLSIPLSWNGGSLEAAARGDYNALYTQAAQKIFELDANGQQFPVAKQDVIYVRTGWEHNLYGQMPWASNGKEAAFVTAFQNFATAFRAVSPKFKIVYGPNIGGDDWRITYPGDAYCDAIGMDFYHYPEFGAPSDPYLAWDFMLTQQYGLNDLVTFANAHGKRICIPEWGVRLDYFGPYIKLYRQWCVDNNVLYSNYWDSDGAYPSKLSNGNRLPATGAAYRHYFNPTKYPTEPLVQVSLMAGAQDIGNSGQWYNGYVGNGTVTRSPNTLVFDGAGNASGNQQVSFVQNTVPVGNYLFAGTFTRTAGTDTVSLWVVDQGGNNIKTADLDTTKLPMNSPTRVSIPFTVASRMTRGDVRFFHGQGGTVTIKATDLGLFEDTTVDPTPHAGGA